MPHMTHMRARQTHIAEVVHAHSKHGTQGRRPCRTTIFSNYAEKNCPAADAQLPTICMGDQSAPASDDARPGPWWSLMFEVSESQYKPVEWQETVQVGGRDVPKIVAATIEGAINTKLIQSSDEIVSIYHRRCGALDCASFWKLLVAVSQTRTTAGTAQRRGVAWRGMLCGPVMWCMPVCPAVFGCQHELLGYYL